MFEYEATAEEQGIKTAVKDFIFGSLSFYNLCEYVNDTIHYYTNQLSQSKTYKQDLITVGASYWLILWIYTHLQMGSNTPNMEVLKDELSDIINYV